MINPTTGNESPSQPPVASPLDGHWGGDPEARRLSPRGSASKVGGAESYDTNGR